jgi:serine/threonine-protein kinase
MNDTSSSSSQTTRSRHVLRRPPPELWGRALGGRYRVDCVIGTGGMGTVYAATDLLGGGSVAIKCLNGAGLTTTDLRRLARESKMASIAPHEHICRTYQFGIEQGTPFLVMERLVGETVRARLRQGPFKAGDAIAITLQLLDALTAAHAAGVLHRDVKPSNVFLTTPPGQPPRIKLIDFGLARPLPQASTDLPVLSDEDYTITTTDNIPGTPWYLTPEQLGGARDLDARVDVWAAGLTLVEMLTGRRAQTAAGAYEVLAAEILRAPPPVVAGQRHDVPLDLDVVVARALAKDRRDRFPSATAFRQALVEVWARHRARAIRKGGILKRAPSTLVESLRPPPPPAPDVEWIEIVTDGDREGSSS